MSEAEKLALFRRAGDLSPTMKEGIDRLKEKLDYDLIVISKAKRQRRLDEIALEVQILMIEAEKLKQIT